MTDARLQRRLRDGEATRVDLLRAGLVRVRCWDGYGSVDGHGAGDGYGGSGYGSGYGGGYGYGYGSGNGYGNGYGDGSGKTERHPVRYTEIYTRGTPVVVRSYTSGVFVGRLHDGEGGVVVLTDCRWLRRWAGVGGEGSVYDLIESGVTPQRRGPQIAGPEILQQADCTPISEECYTRLYG